MTLRRLILAAAFATCLVVSVIVGWLIFAPGSKHVFDGVSDADLANFGVVLTERTPAATARVTLRSIEAQVLAEPGIIVEASQLVRLRLVSRSGAMSNEYTAWALRLDTSDIPENEGFGPGFWISRGPDMAIVFFDGETGDNIATFVQFSGPTSPAASPTLTS